VQRFAYLRFRKSLCRDSKMAFPLGGKLWPLGRQLGFHILKTTRALATCSRRLNEIFGELKKADGNHVKLHQQMFSTTQMSAAAVAIGVFKSRARKSSSGQRPLG
jgi:hypothetical protein